MIHLTIREAAGRLNVSPGLLARYCREGRIPGSVLCGRLWLIPESGFQAFRRDHGAYRPGRPASITSKRLAEGRLPFYEVIWRGIARLESRRAASSLPALLVSIGAPRLKMLGLKIARTIPDPERRLYDHLARRNPGRPVHSLYNSHLRRLVKFERALACATRRA